MKSKLYFLWILGPILVFLAFFIMIEWKDRVAMPTPDTSVYEIEKIDLKPLFP